MLLTDSRNRHHAQREPKSAKCHPRIAGLLVALGLALLLPAPAQASHILVLHSQQAGTAVTEAFNAGIKDQLPVTRPDRALYHEYLDAGRFPDPDYLSRFADMLDRKYRDVGLMAVIAVGAPAIALVQTIRPPALTDLPIVCVGLNRTAAEQASSHYTVTGIVSSATTALAKTVRLARKLHPRARRLYVYYDNPGYDNSILRAVEQGLGEISSDGFVVYRQELALPALLKEVAQIPADSIVLPLVQYRNEGGSRYDHADIVRMIANATPAPIYGIRPSALATGAIVGGWIPDHRAEGREAARLVARVLAGDKVSDLELVQVDAGNWMFNAAMTERFGIRPDDLPADRVIVGPDASFFEVYRYRILATVLIILLQALAIIWLLASGRRRRAAESERQKNEDLLKTILENVVYGVVTIDEAGTIQSFNASAERIFGHRASDVLGRNVDILMTRPDAEAHASYVAAYLKTGTSRIIGIGREVTGRRRNGEEFPLDLQISEIQLDKGRLFVATMRDLTAEKEAEERLRRIDRLEAVSQLTGGIAHDFNNLLAIIIGNAELAAAIGTASDSGLDKPLRAIRRAAARAARLTQGLLAFSRQQLLRRETFDVNQQIIDMRDRLAQIVGSHTNVTLRLSDDLPPLTSDPHQLETVLVNLASNARDAMPDGGTLAIETRPVTLRPGAEAAAVGLTPGAYVAISVSDTGHGMPPAVLEKVFEPFFTTKEVGSGSGLGLSMIYGFAKQSNGTVVAESTEGEGTTITLYLPIGETAECHPPSEAAAETEDDQPAMPAAKAVSNRPR